jgi:polyphosphate kinase
MSGKNGKKQRSDDERSAKPPEKMKRQEYEKQKALLQVELLKMQRWVGEEDKRVVILFEGRDAAGKGGTIKRFMENLNPRGARVVALAKPTDEERGQWYFQRYVQHLPSKGEIVFFDRSWYNRAGVERVMGFCTEEEYREFMRTVSQFEQMLVRSGVVLVKFWFEVSQKEQQRRFQDRAGDPLKQWKLSPVDLASAGKWAEYSEARNEMFARTDLDEVPWTVVLSNDKKRARINSMLSLLSRLDYEHKDKKISHAPDPQVVNRMGKLLLQLN